MADMVQRNRYAAKSMSTSIAPTLDDVLAALRAFILSQLPEGVEIIAAQDNGVPMPTGPFIAMTPISAVRLSTNITKYVDGSLGAKVIAMPVQLTVQIDCYGPESGSWAQIIAALFRDDAAYAAFPSEIKPLYADDLVQMPVIDGEQQFEQRWKFSAVMQYSPIISIAQQSAAALCPGVIEVDAAYPP